MSYNTVTVTGTATKIVNANTQRQSLIIANAGSVTVYIGPDASVTTANGTPIVAGGNLTEDSCGTRVYLGTVYGIVSTGTCDVRYWERTI
jgi:hypothetical protein